MEDGADASRDRGSLNSSVLVLNRYYVPIRVTSARRAFALLYTGKAEAVDVDGGETFQSFDFRRWTEFSSGRHRAPHHRDEFVRTPSLVLLVPRVLRLVDYDRVPRREVKFNRKNILARDDYRCQYCGRRFPAQRLSIDHVIPKSRGGRTVWTNVVTACATCNTRKGGRLPSEVNMRLLRPPTAPRTPPLADERMREERYRVWALFLKSGTLVESSE